MGSVQDATMHAPFGALVQSNVRNTQRNQRRSALHVTAVVLSTEEATPGCCKARKAARLAGFLGAQHLVLSEAKKISGGERAALSGSRLMSSWDPVESRAAVIWRGSSRSSEPALSYSQYRNEPGGGSMLDGHGPFRSFAPRGHVVIAAILCLFITGALTLLTKRSVGCNWIECVGLLGVTAIVNVPQRPVRFPSNVARLTSRGSFERDRLPRPRAHSSLL